MNYDYPPPGSQQPFAPDGTMQVQTHRKRPIWPYIAIGAGVLILLLVAGAVSLIVWNKSPLTKDSGVVACEQMTQEKGGPLAANKTSDGKWTEQQYRDARKIFANSRYEDLSKAGTHLVDVIWQVNGLKDDDPSILIMAGQITSAYTDLSGACAAHGVTIKPLMSN